MLSSLPSIGDAATRIKAGELSPLELVEHCLARIEQFEEQVHAWVLVDAEGARRQAEQLARQLADSNSYSADERPLLGIPVGIKDIIDVAGMSTRAGSLLREHHIAERDATLVDNLRQAGAIILGKTVTTEFACFDPSPTRNPWNLAHTPGGSSSGSAAAVAREMCMGAVGSQTGGSITRPASYCGVCGLKPHRGAVSLEGVVPVSFTLDHPGPIARSAGDLQCMFAGLLAPGAFKLLVEAEANREQAPLPPELYRLGGFFDETCDPAVREVVDAAVEKLAAAGARIESVEPPASLADVHRMHRRIMAAEAAEYHRRQFAEHRDSYGPHVASLIEEGLAMPAVDYAEALKHRERFCQDLYRILQRRITILPATPTTAPASLETTGNPAFNSPFSYAGMPAVNIPCGLAADGMPCGLQLVGDVGGNLELLRVASWCEQQLGFTARPPTLAANASRQ